MLARKVGQMTRRDERGVWVVIEKREKRVRFFSFVGGDEEEDDGYFLFSFTSIIFLLFNGD